MAGSGVWRGFPRGSISSTMPVALFGGDHQPELLTYRTEILRGDRRPIFQWCR